MPSQEKNIRKAIGGLARAKALSPERRREIAQKAAVSRWSSSDRPPPKARPSGNKKFVKVPTIRTLTVTSQFEEDGTTLKTITVGEGARVLRRFSSELKSTAECVDSYLAALRDLGVTLKLV